MESLYSNYSDTTDSDYSETLTPFGTTCQMAVAAENYLLWLYVYCWLCHDFIKTVRQYS